MTTQMNNTVSTSSRAVRNSAMSYLVSVNPNSTKGRKFGIVGLRPNESGFEGAVIKGGQYAMEYFNDVFAKDETGNYIMDGDHKAFAYQPLDMPEGYGFTGATVYAARLALCSHYKKMTEGKEHNRLVQIYTPASVAMKLWRAQSFVNGKANSLLSDKQLASYSEEDAAGLTEELEAFAKTLQAINQAGVTVGIKNYEELEFTVMKTQPENFSRFNGEKASFNKGKAALSDGTIIESEYSINGSRELAVRKDPFGNGTVLVALKDPKYSNELMAGIGMRTMLRMIMPTKQNVVADFARELINQAQARKSA